MRVGRSILRRDCHSPSCIHIQRLQHYKAYSCPANTLPGCWERGCSVVLAEAEEHQYYSDYWHSMVNQIGSDAVGTDPADGRTGFPSAAMAFGSTEYENETVSTKYYRPDE